MAAEQDDGVFGTCSVKLNRSMAPSLISRFDLKHSKYKCSIKLPIFLPFGQFKSIWNVFLLIILIYSVVEIPYTLAFGDYGGWSATRNPVAIFGLFIDFCLSFDILLNFRTAYIDKYDRLRYVANSRLIAKKYLSSWFIIDLFASFPFAYIIDAVAEMDPNLGFNDHSYSYMTFQYLRLLRLTKLLRIIKIFQMFRIFQQHTFDHSTLTIMNLVKIIGFMLLTAHYCACFWFLIGQYAYLHNERSWIDIIVQEHGDSANNIIKYSYSFYWSIVTLFTTGYGDIHATNIYEQWTCSLCILIGSCFFAYFIGVLTTFLGQHRVNQYEHDQVEESLLFCAHYNLPSELRRAVLTHIRYFCHYNYIFDEEQIMNALPNNLQKDIQHYIAASILKGLDIFQSLPTSIIGQIALKLKSKSCNVGHKLFESGDIGKELFIQRTGKSKLYLNVNNNSNSGQYRLLKRGDVCGENVVISRKRVNTLQCMTWSEFYILNISDIINILKNNYDLKTAKKEWNKIKNIIRISASSTFVSLDSDKLPTLPRHVKFRSFNLNKEKFATFVESAVCDDKSVVSNKSFLVQKPRDYNKFEAELQRQDDIEEFERIKRKKKRKTSFQSIQQMFNLNSGDRQRSHTRDESIRLHNKLHKSIGMTPLIIGLPHQQYGSFINVNQNSPDIMDHHVDDDDDDDDDDGFYSNDEYTEEHSAGFGYQIGTDDGFNNTINNKDDDQITIFHANYNKDNDNNNNNKKVISEIKGEELREDIEEDDDENEESMLLKKNNATDGCGTVT